MTQAGGECTGAAFFLREESQVLPKYEKDPGEAHVLLEKLVFCLNVQRRQAYFTWHYGSGI